jgi:hypothetical protein
MDWVSDAASKRHFESFAAEASESLLRTGYLMTGDAILGGGQAGRSSPP